MDWLNLELDGQRSVKFSGKCLPVQPVAAAAAQRASSAEENGNNVDELGGIFKQGSLAWLSQKNALHIVSLRTGQMLCSYEFSESNGYDGYYIKCVEPLECNTNDQPLLAVCLCSYFDTKEHISLVALFSVQHGYVLSCMSLKLNISCCSFLNDKICQQTLLKIFDGCLVVASEEGVIILLDLNICQLLDIQNQHLMGDVFKTCHIVDYSLELNELTCHFKQSRLDGAHFCIKMEVMESPCAISSILPIGLILGLAVGLDDGRMILYDLDELQVFYVRKPTQDYDSMPVLKMCYILPNDDPYLCFYIWTVHGDGQCLWGILHKLMYENRSDDNKFFETFNSYKTCMLCPLDTDASILVNCQSLTRVVPLGSNDDSICLTAFTWYSIRAEVNKLLLFDVNQWYKDEIPSGRSARQKSNYLAGYNLDGRFRALHARINETTVAHFNSMQRYEEHFYPNALSFDCMLLLSNDLRYYNCVGIQNQFIARLRAQNAAIFLEPERCFEQVLRCRLMPQFQELNMHATFSKNAKYNVLLSVALEHNCISLLRDCIKSWSDGSCMGNLAGASNGLSLSTLTDWIWKRANDIKWHCHDICRQLCAFSDYSWDDRTKKEFGYLTRQLKLLSELLADVLKLGKQGMPENVYATLRTRHITLCMAAEYQNVFLWLVSIGLLPDNTYPHKQLQRMYASKRNNFAKCNEALISKKTGSCRFLYIDTFIEQSCKSGALREQWLESGGNGLYPPVSIEVLLRIMLISDLSYDNKCAILLYGFLDLHMAMQEKIYKQVPDIVKFPSVFKLSASLTKTVQAFWNLDHGHFLCAVDEFVSPFNVGHNYQQWQLELLIETLLHQNCADLALRVLKAHANSISPVLRLKTMLANELIAEAFYYARSVKDSNLLELFFSICLCSGKYGIVRDLALTDAEGQLLLQVLKKSKLNCAKSLHFVYLLQKNKYIEAVSYMDELAHAQNTMRLGGGSSVNKATLETSNVMLSAFNTTMTPVTQGLTDVYFRIRNKIKQKEMENQTPVPLSCQLIKQNANNLLGGLYHSSALSAHFASYYWGQENQADSQQQQQTQNLLSANNAPFLRKPQPDADLLHEWQHQQISYPQPYKPNEKRKQSISESEEMEGKQQQQKQENPKKKRRLLAQDILKDLSQLPTSKTTLKHWQFPAKANNDATNEPEKTTLLLAQPLEPQKAIVASPVCNRQGILKSHTPEPTLRKTMHTTLFGEEKSLRFNLSTVDNEKEQQPEVQQVEAQQAEVQQAEVHKVEAQQVEAQPKEASPDIAGVVTSRTYTRTLSEDSNKSTSSIIQEDNDVNNSIAQDDNNANNFITKDNVFNSIAQDENIANNSIEQEDNNSFNSIAQAENNANNTTVTLEDSTDDMFLSPLAIKNEQSQLDRSLANETFYSARSKFSISSIGSRASLHRMSIAMQQQKSEEDNMEDLGKKSSGYASLTDTGRYKTVEYGSTISSTVTAITSNEFQPQICSSKVAPTQSKFLLERKRTCEYTTVLADDEEFIANEETVAMEKPQAIEVPSIATQLQQQPSLNSTLDTSRYDLTVIVGPPLSQTKALVNFQNHRSDSSSSSSNSMLLESYNVISSSSEYSTKEDEDEDVEAEEEEVDEEGASASEDEENEDVQTSSSNSEPNQSMKTGDDNDSDDADIIDIDIIDDDVDDGPNDDSDVVIIDDDDNSEYFAKNESDEEQETNTSSSASGNTETSNHQPQPALDNQSNSEHSMLKSVQPCNYSANAGVEVSTPSALLAIDRQYKLFQDNELSVVVSPIASVSYPWQKQQEKNEIAANTETAKSEELKADINVAVENSSVIEVQNEEESIVLLEDSGQESQKQSTEKIIEQTTQQLEADMNQKLSNENCELVNIKNNESLTEQTAENVVSESCDESTEEFVEQTTQQLEADINQKLSNENCELVNIKNNESFKEQIAENAVSEVVVEKTPSELLNDSDNKVEDSVEATKSSVTEQTPDKTNSSDTNQTSITTSLILADSPKTSRSVLNRYNRKRQNARGASVPPHAENNDIENNMFMPRRTLSLAQLDETASDSHIWEPNASTDDATTEREIAYQSKRKHRTVSTGSESNIRQRLTTNLEVINEQQILDSPSTRTRARVRRSIAGSDVESVATSENDARSKRATSIFSETNTPRTPKRKKRGNVAHDESDIVSTPSTSKSARLAARSATPKSTQQVREAVTPSSSIDKRATSLERDLLLSERRMTRHELQMLQKNSARYASGSLNSLLDNTDNLPTPSKGRKRQNKDNLSPARSVVSNISQQSKTSSSRMMTRSLFKQMHEKDDETNSSVTSSYASTKSNKRARKSDRKLASPLDPIDETD